MSNMSALYVGLSGLVNSSNALNTTANNLTNVNTKGYVRQQVFSEDIAYNTIARFATNTLQQGLGMRIQDVEHVRDILLDEAYRKENGRQGFYDKLLDAADEIQTQLGEMNGVSFQNSLTDLVAALNEVAKAPEDNTARAALVENAITFLDRAQSIYSGLEKYQSNLNTDIEKITNRINEIGAQIVDLNQKVSHMEGGPDTAMTLRDERDLLLDELSEYVKIDITEDARGVVTVFVENNLFCDAHGVSKLALDTIPGTDFYIPVWENMLRQPLYQMEATISTEKNTDIGSLKGMLAARGEESPTFNSEAKSGDYSLLVRTMKNFDELVNSIVTSINDILSPVATTATAITGTDEKGNAVTFPAGTQILDTTKTGYGQDPDKTPGTELFSRKYTDRYIKVDGDDGNTYYVRNDTNSFGFTSDYSTSNLEVNPDVLQNFSYIPLSTEDGKVDYEKAKALVELFSEDHLTFMNGLEKLTFEEFYEFMIDDIGSEGKVYQSMASNQETLSNGLDDARQQIMSVSSDEELTNMIKYQQAYNAASRYINVITTMMDTVIDLMS